MSYYPTFTLRNLTGKNKRKKMRVALNYLIPVLQDPVDDRNFNKESGKVFSSITSNGYYGYQPITSMQLNEKNKNDCIQEMDTTHCEDIEFNCLVDVEQAKLKEYNQELHRSTVTINRKRAWEYGNGTEDEDRKRRRENEAISIVSRNYVTLKQPTHNVPDIPRCIMGHYI